MCSYLQGPFMRIDIINRGFSILLSSIKQYLPRSWAHVGGTINQGLVITLALSFKVWCTHIGTINGHILVLIIISTNIFYYAVNQGLVHLVRSSTKVFFSYCYQQPKSCTHFVAINQGLVLKLVLLSYEVFYLCCYYQPRSWVKVPSTGSKVKVKVATSKVKGTINRGLLLVLIPSNKVFHSDLVLMLAPSTTLLHLGNLLMLVP